LLSGRFDASYAYVRPDARTPFQRDYRLAWNHSQSISSQTQFTANLNFQSNTFNTNTITTLQQRIQKNVFSSAGLSHTFENNVSASLNYTRNQDVEARTYEQSPVLSLTVPAFFPFKTRGSSSWLSDVSINYSSVVAPTFTHGLDVTRRDTTFFDSVANRPVTRTLLDSTYTDSYRAVWRHSPSITISPKLGVISVTPALNFSANAYPRRIAARTYDTARKATSDIVENGMFMEYSTSVGITTRTTLYGTPVMLGNVALRHTLMPSVGISYTPDLSSESTGFYSTYLLPPDSLHTNTRAVRYSRFALDGGGIASQRRALLMNWALDNSLDAKVFKDSADEKVELARINVSGNVNFLLDSNRMSDIQWSIRTPTVGESSLTASFSTTLYDDVQLRDTAGRRTSSYSRLATTLLDAGKFPLRVNALNLFFSTSFGSDASSFRSSSSERSQSTDDTTRPSLGDRFRQRTDYEDSAEDVFGDSSPGHRPLLFPWQVSMSLTYSYQRPFSEMAATQN
ncbi:MAG: putative LPS assembly protein LptD, partial [Candidatus Kapaibacterium sp.]